MAKTHLYLVNNSKALRPESTRILLRQMKLIYRALFVVGIMLLGAGISGVFAFFFIC